MIKKIFILLKIARKLALSDALKIVSKIHEPPLIIKIFLGIFSISLFGKINQNLNLSDEERLCNSIQDMGTTFIKLGQFLSTRPDIIGENIRTKAPSAELGPNQLDTDSLPPYSVLDNILKGIIEEKKDLQQLEEDGYKKDLILKIISLIKKAEFKRKQAPPILKLSSQSLGSDWRVPIAISY